MIVIHTSVLFFQMITLNVAINFYSNALLSLLISNQFVEIKQNVFKKFEKENLFQLTCAGNILQPTICNRKTDIVYRYCGKISTVCIFIHHYFT